LPGLSNAVTKSPCVAERFYNRACCMSLYVRYSAHELSDPYTAGAAIRWLKALGPWSDADVEERLLPCYPKVICESVIGCYTEHRPFGEPTKGSLGKATPNRNKSVWWCERGGGGEGAEEGSKGQGSSRGDHLSVGKGRGGERCWCWWSKWCLWLG
jgi:hypothetical protein